MKRWFQVVCIVMLAVGAAAVLRWRRTHGAPLPSLPATFSAAMPRRVLWAWEEPEDLRALPATVGVAYLAETILLSDHVAVLPRQQPLQPAPGAPVMAVVRIETRAGFVDSPAMRAEVAMRLAEVGRRDGLRALQVDFDATQSQRKFYAAVLTMLRPQLRQGFPLSMTALVSWCGGDSWLRGLPVDEAVPMFFRMGGPRAFSSSAKGRYRLREPLCRSSIGVATDESWPANFGELNPASRVYIFAPGPWQDAQLAAVATVPNALLSQELAR